MSDVLVLVPCPKLIYSSWWKQVMTWVSESNNRVAIFPETTPNRMDFSISAMISEAKNRNPDVAIRLDADVEPQTPLDEMLRIAKENEKAGFAITGSPSLNERGIIQAALLEDTPLDAAVEPRPYECKWVSGSLNVIPRRVFRAMIPVKRIPIGAFNSDASFDMYIQVQTVDSTEDVDFCMRVRELGFRICADPRIMVLQNRPQTGIPSVRVPMTWGGKVEINLVENPMRAPL